VAEHNETGLAGEKLAKEFLERKKFKLIETNWRSGRLELDLIAMHDQTLVFVEVKTRTSNVHGFPEEAVGTAKEAHMAKAAQQYVEQTSWEGEIRFDLISITLEGPEAGIHHILDAFFPYE